MRLSIHDRHDMILRASRVIPEGYWTAYGEIGAAATGSRRAHRLVARLAAHNPAFSTPWRVLHADGSIAEGWRGHGGGPEKCRELLEAEGVRFVNGRADPEQKILSEEIELLLADAAYSGSERPQ
jgi:alkylated DNA nucleotide flippase Atl1